MRSSSNPQLSAISPRLTLDNYGIVHPDLALLRALCSDYDKESTFVSALDLSCLETLLRSRRGNPTYKKPSDSAGRDRENSFAKSFDFIQKETGQSSRFKDFSSELVSKTNSRDPDTFAEVAGNVYHLDRVELAALKNYTSHGYMVVNQALRKGGSEATKVAPYCRVLQEALKKLPNYSGKVYRGASLPPEVRARYTVGATIEDSAFTSTSVIPEIAQKFGLDDYFEIQSKSGRLVHGVSASMSEAEILFPPGSRFKVKQIQEKKVDGVTQRTYILEELSP